MIVVIDVLLCVEWRYAPFGVIIILAQVHDHSAAMSSSSNLKVDDENGSVSNAVWHGVPLLGQGINKEGDVPVPYEESSSSWNGSSGYLRGICQSLTDTCHQYISQRAAGNLVYSSCNWQTPIPGVYVRNLEEWARSTTEFEPWAQRRLKMCASSSICKECYAIGRMTIAYYLCGHCSGGICTEQHDSLGCKCGFRFCNKCWKRHLKYCPFNGEWLAKNRSGNNGWSPLQDSVQEELNRATREQKTIVDAASHSATVLKRGRESKYTVQRRGLVNYEGGLFPGGPEGNLRLHFLHRYDIQGMKQLDMVSGCTKNIMWRRHPDV